MAVAKTGDTVLKKARPFRQYTPMGIRSHSTATQKKMSDIIAKFFPFVLQESVLHLFS